MMKKITKNITIVALSLPVILASCGGGTPDIAALEKDKKELLNEIKKIDSLIAKNDTTKKDVFYPLVVAKPIKTENFKHNIEVLGTVSSDKNIVLSAEYNGKITAVYVKEGQNVKKGQTIAVIDGQSLSDNENELRTQLEYAEYMLEKQQKLNEKGVGSEFNVKQAENQVNSLKDKIKSLRTMKGKTVVRAPFSGVVEDVIPNAGEFVGAGSPIARIVNVNDITVSANVSEQLLGSLKEGKDGTEISMKFEHLSEPILSNIHTIGKFVEPTNRTVKIRTNLDKNTVLLPNMTGTISITDASIDSANVIPTTAILKDDKNKDFVYVLDEQKEGETYSVKKLYIDVLSSYKGESAVKTTESLKGKRVVDQGGKGITQEDIVKLKL